MSFSFAPKLKDFPKARIGVLKATLSPILATNPKVLIKMGEREK